MSMDSLRALEFLGNSMQQLAVAAGIFVGVVLFFLLLKHWLLERMRAWLRRVPGAGKLLDVIGHIGMPSFTVLSLFVAARGLLLPESVHKGILALTVIVVMFQVITVAQGALEWAVEHHLRRMTGRTDEAEMPAFLRLCIRAALWSVGLLLVLSNIGVDITSLVAGLGIGGIAVALAMQSILSDLFSSFSLYFDKPFQLGDFIIVGDHMGTVKNIGLKTTRIQALQGEEIVIPNAELTGTRVRNFKKMQRRRIQFTFGVTYDTSQEQLKSIPDIVRNVTGGVEQVTLDRAHFKGFGDSSLDFEVVYFVESGDYNLYMDRQQSINMGLVERFAAEKIDFAFPTRTVHVLQQ